MLTANFWIRPDFGISTGHTLPTTWPPTLLPTSKVHESLLRFITRLTLNLLTSTIVAPPSNASKWQLGFNSAFKGLNAELWQHSRRVAGRFCRRHCISESQWWRTCPSTPSPGPEFRFISSKDLILYREENINITLAPLQGDSTQSTKNMQPLQEFKKSKHQKYSLNLICHYLR
jgi:hypothetical protein